MSSVAYQRPDSKPKMHKDSRKRSVMNTHHTESLLQRCAMVRGSHAFGKIINQNLIDIAQFEPLTGGSFHYTYAPVHVGRVTVLQVVRLTAGYVGACVEGLMTHKHAVAERTPGEPFGRCQTAMGDKPSIDVHEIGVAIEHGGQLLTGFYACGYVLKRR